MFDRRFPDRTAAGRDLAAAVARRLGHPGAGPAPLVLALPRGGVAVAAPVAATLGAELDVVVARKISAPGNPELGVGAVAEDGDPVFDHDLLRVLGLTTADLGEAVTRERAEVQRRSRRYREGRPPPVAAGRVVIVVDDGVATGVTARAALRRLRREQPRQLLLAAPVGSPQACRTLATEADEVVCLRTPARFGAVGRFYDDFTQLTDVEVIRSLAAARASPGPAE